MSAAVNFVLAERSIGSRSVLLSLEGDTTATAAERIRERLAEVAARDDVALVVADLSGVTFVDSAVVHGLASAARHARERGTRVLVVEPLAPTVAQPLRR